MSVSVLIVDDHAIVRDGLRQILEREPGLSVIGEAANGRDAVSNAVRLHPDIVLMDITMPELNGIDATRRIRKACPNTRVLILSVHDTAEYIHRALQAGADGYLHKDVSKKELIQAVLRVSRGQQHLDARATDRMRKVSASHSRPSTRSPLEQLSSREREILQLAAEGKSSAAIARVTGLSPKTVDTYRSRLMAKLGVDSFSDLIRFMIEHGLTPPD
jgi:DNA-binding NarL/FixJ family response regulator